MKTKFIANCPDEVEQVFGASFYDESQPQTQPELDERVQLQKFLKIFAVHPSCRYPIHAEIQPRDHKPDFKVIFGNAAVGIEASKIANPELEQVRSYQTKNGFAMMDNSSFLKEGPPRRFKQKLDDSLARPVFIIANPNQLEEEDEFWLDTAKTIIRRKSKIKRKPDFNGFDETWLLLWDKLASSEEELKRRSIRLAEFLSSFWNQDWFKRIIIQENDFSHALMFTSGGVEKLENHRNMPGPDFMFTVDQSLGLE